MSDFKRKIYDFKFQRTKTKYDLLREMAFRIWLINTVQEWLNAPIREWILNQFQIMANLAKKLYDVTYDENWRRIQKEWETKEV